MRAFLRRALITLVGLLALSTGALADPAPGPVVQFPNVSSVTSKTLTNTPQFSLSGYYSTGDGGEGIFVQTTKITAPVTGRAHNATTTLDNLSVSPIASGWHVGDLISDSKGAIPSNTVIVALTASAITTSNASTSGQTNDVFTAVCNNGGTLIADAANNCFRRTNVAGDLRQWGITDGSVYDPVAHPTTVTSASLIIARALAVLPALSLYNIHSHQVSFFIDTDVLLPANTTLTCDVMSGGPSSDGVYTDLPGSIMTAHGATITGVDNEDNEQLTNCVEFPQWLADPSKVSGFGGVSFTAPALTFADMNAIQANMSLASDTAYYVNKVKGSKPHDLWIYGYDNCVHLRSADHLNMDRVTGDCNQGIYAESGGGQTDLSAVNIANDLTKQTNSNVAVCAPTADPTDTKNGVCNQESWTVTAMAASTAVNSYGEHVCRITLGLSSFNGHSTTGWPGTDVHSSVLNANGDPLNYQGWVTNITNGLGCHHIGPASINVISSTSTTAVIDLTNTAYSHGADKMQMTASWSACATAPCPIYIVSGDVLNIQTNMVVADDGTHGVTVGSTVSTTCLSCKGPDPYGGYTAIVYVNQPLTLASSGNQTITFDGLAFTPSTTCNNGGAGDCFFISTSERVIAGSSPASLAVAKFDFARQQHLAACFTGNGVPGLRGINLFCFTHGVVYIAQDSNSCVSTQIHDDDSGGELDNYRKTNFIVAGSTSYCSVQGNGLGKAGTDIIVDLYALNDSHTYSTTSNGSIASTAGATVTTVGDISAWPRDASGQFTVSLCQTTSGGNCEAATDREVATATYVDAHHFTAPTRGTYHTYPCGAYTAPTPCYATGANIFLAVPSATIKYAAFNEMTAGTTDRGLNVAEIDHGNVTLTNIAVRGTTRGFVVSHNAGNVIMSGNPMDSVTLYYEDPTAFAAMLGCGNKFSTTSNDTWQCYAATPFGPTITASFTLDATSHTWKCDATGGDVTITVPRGSSFPNFDYTIKKIDNTANMCILDMTSSDTLDGATAYAITVFNDVIRFKNDGGTAAWRAQ